MVLIHYKKTEKNQFILSTPAVTSISVLHDKIHEINNLRVKLDKLVYGVEGLAEHGPLRPEALRGLTTPQTYDPAAEQLPSEMKHWAYPKPTANQEERPDKTGYRTGMAPCESIRKTMLTETEKAKKLLSDNPVKSKKESTVAELEEHVNLLKGAIMIAYPGYHNLPDWDPVYLILENKIDYLAMFPDCDFMDREKTVLWWAKKELQPQKTIADYVGKNEKTKLLVKSETKGKGAPLHEPPVDENTQKKMMAHYYKKQEEMKKLEEDNEDDYMNSAWANPNYLKNQLVNGGRDISFKSGFR